MGRGRVEEVEERRRVRGRGREDRELECKWLRERRMGEVVEGNEGVGGVGVVGGVGMMGGGWAGTECE